MRARVSHVLVRLQQALDSCGISYRKDGEIFSVDIDGAAARDTVYETLHRTLTSVEREHIRAMFLPAGSPATYADYFDADTLDHHLAMMQAGWLRDVLRTGSLTSVLQPIVYAADPERAFAYEALLRLNVGGELRSAEGVFAVAREAQLLPALDRAARESAINVGAAYADEARIFINFAPSSIYDPVSCLRATLALLEGKGISHENIVFEVIESDRIDDVDHLKNILRYYRERGFGIALDDLGSGYASLKLLNDLRPDFVKIDMDLIRGVDSDPYKAAIASKLIEAAANIDLPVIAEGVETAQEFDWVVDRGVRFVQGFYVGRPAMPPTISSASPRRAMPGVTTSQ
jgi:EAL domain-containing protein (putative c-di-GMP-specific phosphodiesterase class I)